MKIKGIRISDIEDGKCIPLSKILTNIPKENQLYWGVLWLDVTPLEKQGSIIHELQLKIDQSENGLHCTFEFLMKISEKIFQEIDMTIIACHKKENLRRYKDDQEMYETCDIVIEMIDGGFWEIFSKNIKWINQLAKKFREVEFLSPDFKK